VKLDRQRAVQRSLGTLLWERAENTGDAPFLVGPGALTYGQARDAAARLAGGLRDLGIGPGDLVATLLRNGPELLLTWLGSAALGAVEVPINPVYRGASLEYLLNHCAASVLVIDAERLDMLRDLATRVTGLELVVVVGDEPPADLPWRAVSYERLLMSEPITEPAADPAALMAIVYTSGTTGHPKGVMESHRCAMHWGVNYAESMELGPTDCNYLFPPLFHAMSQFLGVVPAMITGGRVALGDGFSASRFWDDCRRDGVTLFNFTGGVLSFLYKQPPRGNDRDHSVTRALGVPIPDHLYPAFEDRFGVTLLPPFGTSESNVVCYSRPGEVRAGSSGRAIDAFEVRIVDEDGMPLGPGEKGEIVTRPKHPDSMMRGYYRQPEETIAALRDLWYHTNDMGYLDADGYLFFVDRKKDAIRRRGENISSFEVERIVDRLDQVVESAAVGIPSEHGEEEVKLCVVLAAGAELSAEALWAYCEQEMPPFMVPRFVEFCDELPRTETERVRKFELRDRGIHDGVIDREKVLR
jgi:carnitine-CoA ligase